MDNEKMLPADYISPLPYPSTTTTVQTNNTYQPPAYAEDPPPYNCVTETHAYHYSYTEGSPAQPGTAYPHSLPSSHPAPMPYPDTNQYPSQGPNPLSYPGTAPMPYPDTNQYPSQGPTPPSYPGTAPMPAPNPSHVPPQKALLQPGPGKVVETTATGRRKKQSIVTDLESGKQYVVNEKTSRHGRRHKTVIREMGGPVTVVKETPSKTVVKQRHG